MREPAFITHLQGMFPRVATEWHAARHVAGAMIRANEHGTGTVFYDHKRYRITMAWTHSCYRGDCNPATCWADWGIDEIPPEPVSSRQDTTVYHVTDGEWTGTDSGSRW